MPDHERPYLLETPSAAVFSGTANSLHPVGADALTSSTFRGVPGQGFAALIKRGVAHSLIQLNASTEQEASAQVDKVAVEMDVPITLGRVVRVGGSVFAPVLLVEGIKTVEKCTLSELLEHAVIASYAIADACTCGHGQLAKAKKPPIDPTDPAAFSKLVISLKNKLNRVAGNHTAEDVRRVIDSANVDWTKASAAQMKTLSDRLQQVIASRTQKTFTAAKGQAVKILTTVVHKNSVATQRRYSGSVKSSLSLKDSDAAVHAMYSGMMYVKDAAGKISANLTNGAAKIISDMINKGSGREEIVERLKNELGPQAANLTRNYLEVVADAWVARSRTYSTLKTFEHSGITKYEIEAALDDVTCNACRMLHGKIFPVSNAVKQFESAPAQGVKSTLPWVSERTIPKGQPNAGKTEIYVRGGPAIGTCTDSAVGTSDEVGEFVNVKSEADMVDAHIGPPPFHGRCRCILMPVVDEVPDEEPVITPQPPPPPPEPPEPAPSVPVVQPQPVKPPPTAPTPKPPEVVPWPEPAPQPVIPKPAPAAPKPAPAAPKPRVPLPGEELSPERELLDDIAKIRERHGTLEQRVLTERFNEQFLDELSARMMKYLNAKVEDAMEEWGIEAINSYVNKQNFLRIEAEQIVMGKILQTVHADLLAEAGGSMAAALKADQVKKVVGSVRGGPASFKYEVAQAWTDVSRLWAADHFPKNKLRTSYSTARANYRDLKIRCRSDRAPLCHEMGHFVADDSAIVDPKITGWVKQPKDKGKVAPVGESITDCAFDNVHRWLHFKKHGIRPGREPTFNDFVTDALKNTTPGKKYGFYITEAGHTKEIALDIDCTHHYIGKWYKNFGYSSFGEEGASKLTEYLATQPQNLGMVYLNTENGKRWVGMGMLIMNGGFFR